MTGGVGVWFALTAMEKKQSGCEPWSIDAIGPGSGQFSVENLFRGSPVSSSSPMY